jgi:indole-3-glycerol phosphate synthase
MSARQRLSESISEGDGISTLVRVAGPTEAEAAEASGAEGVLVIGSVEGIRAATSLPILVRGHAPDEAGASGADAWLLIAELDLDELEERYSRARELGFECVVDVHDEEELDAVLARIDPEIVMLSSRAAERAEDAVDCVLELLPDVPAGKLVVAELAAPTAEDLEALERAGIDAVLVGSRGVAAS